MKTTSHVNDTARQPVSPERRFVSGAPTAQRTFHILAQVFAVLIFVATASAQSPAALPPGSIAWWPGNTNANDFIGTNHASLHGGATIVPGGKVGGAFSFSGGGYVLLPANIFPLPPTATNNAPFSFETWFKTSGSGVILGSNPVNPANAPTRSDGGTMLPMYVGTDGKLRAMLFWVGVQAVSSNAVNDNVWHHVGVTFDGNIEAAYLDGQLFSSVTFTQQPYASFIYYQLGYGFADNAWAGWGGSPGNGGFPFGSWGFSGLIDEPTIYNRALTATEVQAIYSAGSAGKTPVPVILEHPANQLAPLGSDATFSVLAVANPPSPLFYRWWFNHTNEIVGQTNHSLAITNVTLGHAGLYSVEVSNVTGSVVSETAILTVFDPDDPTTRPPGDQLTYLQKYLYGLDPLTPDTDGDGLSDYDELFVHGTNPLLADSDGDGMPDGWEIQHGLNPRFDDAANDLDGDGLSNLAEYQWNLAHDGALDPRQRFSTSPTRSGFAVVTGAGTNRFCYDRTDRVVGAEYDRGLSLAYVYDGNGNLTRQVALRHDANANGLPDLREIPPRPHQQRQPPHRHRRRRLDRLAGMESRHEPAQPGQHAQPARQSRNANRLPPTRLHSVELRGGHGAIGRRGCGRRSGHECQPSARAHAIADRLADATGGRGRVRYHLHRRGPGDEPARCGRKGGDFRHRG